jgi:hypothetical protein
MQEMAAVNSRPRLIRSDRPYATISEGLAIIPSLQQRFNIIQNALREEKPAFISEKIYPLIERRMEEAAQRIADAVATSLFDQRIRPVFQDFSQKGGSVASLKQRIAQQAAIFEPQIKSIVEQEVSQVLSGLPAAVVELMTQWFKDHDLVVEHQLNREDLDSIVDSGVSLKDIDIYGDIEAIIGTISVGIIATLVASISGGGGTALIATGPFGLIIGAIIGVAVGALVISVGLDEAKRRAENWDGAPLWLIRQALSEKKVNGVRDDLRRQVREKTIEHTDKAKQQLEQQITIRVEEEIKNLSVINQL